MTSRLLSRGLLLVAVSCHALGVNPIRAKAADVTYPWQFTGRLWFRPALVKAPPDTALPDGVICLSLFGWTVGGSIALQYSDSPVLATPEYHEFVRMGGLVTKRGAFGLWGSRLYVSTQEAQADNIGIWGVPAEAASIEYEESGRFLRVDVPPPLEDHGNDPPIIKLSGWQATRTDQRLRMEGWDAIHPFGTLPMMWTPHIKVIWSPLVLIPNSDGVPLLTRPLRLSASSLRLHVCAQLPSRDLGVPSPVGLTVDGLRIEIGDPPGDDL